MNYAHLRTMRRHRGISQETLARRAGITQATIHRMETGKAKPHYGTLRNVARALGVPLEDLIKMFDRGRPQK